MGCWATQSPPQQCLVTCPSGVFGRLLQISHKTTTHGCVSAPLCEGSPIRCTCPLSNRSSYLSRQLLGICTRTCDALCNDHYTQRLPTSIASNIGGSMKIRVQRNMMISWYRTPPWMQPSENTLDLKSRRIKVCIIQA